MLYHSTNICFNVYTKSLHAENEDAESENDVTTLSNTKNSTPMLQKNYVPPRDQPLTENRHNANSKERNCVLCGSNRLWDTSLQKYIYLKYRLCKPDALQFFLVANKFFQDKVYSRKAYLTSINLITITDLIYHKKFYTKYSWKYERAQNGNDNVKNNVKTKLANRKEQTFHLALKELRSRINKGM